MNRNVPATLTSLIGREREIDNLRQLLVSPAVRLVTLTGPGGVGKTRLALAVTQELRDDFSDGVNFISLASLADAMLVIPSIASHFGLRADASHFAMQELYDFLREKQILLLLDNFEQVASAAPALIDLLAATTRVKILVTSRVVLRVRGEYEFAVPPLQAASDANPAVALFLERAAAHLPHHIWNTDERAAIAEICKQLDGLPLAIELAAARVNLLSPQMLLTRLENRFALLTNGARDLPARQQTLRNTLTWSYDLLDADAQRVFRRLAIFVGGGTLEATEQVCGATLGTLTTIQDHSLLDAPETNAEDARLVMLETIRAFAREQLQASGEHAAMAYAHRSYFVESAERATPHLLGVEQQHWLDSMEREHNNFRTALQSAIESGDAESALRLGAALARFWYARGFLSEGYHWLEQSLGLAQEVSPQVRLGALNGAGLLAASVGLYARTATLSEESLRLARALNDGEQVVAALNGLGNASLWRGDYARALECFHETVHLYESSNNRSGLARARAYVAFTHWFQDKMDRAESLFQEALARAREIGDRWCIGFCLYGLAFTRVYQENYAQARLDIHEAAKILSALRDRRSLVRVHSVLGVLEDKNGNPADAWTHHHEALSLAREIGEPWSVTVNANSLASWLIKYGDAARGVALLSASKEFRAGFGGKLPPVFERDIELAAARARVKLNTHAFKAAWAEGKIMGLERALAQFADAMPAQAFAGTRDSAGLSPREREVLQLVAEGLTDAQIAERLVVSIRTVHTHVSNILSKLGVKSRVGAARYAVEHGLANP